ncbi:MAG: SagB/ThcOx family dehydrogenase [Candidatus Cloacimonetes bacterium]|nr:SagB/ThcOx family dehydrogenase [Candidatus Cloacimonadota bacterium]
MNEWNERRELLRANFVDIKTTHQKEGKPQPPILKKVSGNIISLPEHDNCPLINNKFPELVKSRQSRREYSDQSISLDELSFLLWTTQGIKRVFKRFDASFIALRTVPSGGCRHPFETYLAVNRVEGLEQGLYFYDAEKHELIKLKSPQNLPDLVTEACSGQNFAGSSAVCFFWSVIPYRSEWRYSFAAHKTILLDAGHVCQNLYLAAESIGCGVCAIAAYDQQKADSLLELDGEDEFVIYIAPVGKQK